MTNSGTIEPLVSESLLVTAMTPRMRLRRLVRLARELHQREHLRVRAEIMRIPGLMALLMKSRNGERWNTEDRALLQAQLRGLGVLSLYIATMAIPGSTLALPLLAWWLDRRRLRRTAALSADSPNKDTTPPNP
jgi:hypothetical protein